MPEDNAREGPQLDLDPAALRGAALRNAPDHILVLDRDLTIRYINFTTVGVDPEEALGARVTEFLAQSDAQRFRDACERIERTRSSARFDVAFRRPDGGVARFESHLGPILEKGEIVGYVLVTSDVTERRLAEEDLRKSELRYRSLIEDQEEFVVRWLPDGTRTFVNYAYCRYFGGKRSDHLGKSFFPLIAEADREAVEREIRGLTPENPVHSGEHRVIRADGTVGWNEWVDRAFFDDQGRLVELQSVGRDITERKRAEQALRASEERYRTLFEDAKDAVFESTPEGRIVDINDAGVELLGYSSREELQAVDDIGRTLYFVPGDRDRFRRRLERDGYVKNAEVTLRRKDGGRVTVLESASVIRDPDGKVVAYRGILHDISERRRLERRLWQAQRMESVGKLAGGVAHDFNNLLTVILGNAELLIEQMSLEDPRRSALEEIGGAARRANALTSRLLAFGRRQLMVPEVMSVNEIVRETEAMLGRMLDESIRLEVRLDPDLGAVRADPGQVQQVLFNLVFNARDAMPRGGTLSIQTSNVDWAPSFSETGLERQGGDWVRLSVEDTGVGISREDQERIFEPFFTTKAPERGTGLGLASVYGIVKQSGGYITVDSRLGEGACFDVFLPRVASLPEAREPAEQIADPGGETGGQVLLVEDEAGVRTLASRVLSRAGYRVVVAEDGEEALRIAKQSGRRLDLLVTDVVMPKMSGFELVRHLEEWQPGLRVLFLTGHSDEAVWRLGAATNEHHVLKKPFGPRELLDTARRVIAGEAAPGG